MFIEEPPQFENKSLESDELLHKFTDVENPRLEQLSEYEKDELLQAFDDSPDIQKYRRGKFTVERMEETRSVLLNEALTRNIKEQERQQIIEEHATLLQKVITAVSYYAQIVRGFKSIEMQRFRLEREDYLGRMKDHDERRRRAHNTMIDDFRAYNRFLNIQLHDQYGIDLSLKFSFDIEMFPSNKDGRFIARDHSIDWALDTDYFLRARNLIEQIKKERQPGAAAPNESAED